MWRTSFSTQVTCSFALLDDVMKYRVCFIIAIGGSRNIRNDTPQGMEFNVTHVTRLTLYSIYIYFFSSSLAVGKKRAFASLSADRKAEDRRCRLRQSVIPWNRTCYCKLPRVSAIAKRAELARSLSEVSPFWSICWANKSPNNEPLPPLRYVGTVTKYFSSSTAALGVCPRCRDAYVLDRRLISTKISFRLSI